MRPRSLTTKLAILTATLTCIVIIVTGLVFALSYKYVVDNDIKNYLTKEGGEVANEQIVFDNGEIKYRLGPKGETLAARLRDYELSAAIYDGNLKLLGVFGIYKNILDSGKFETDIDKTIITNVAKRSSPLFSSFSVPSGQAYEAFTIPVVADGRMVGVVQFAKQSTFAARVVALNISVLLFLLPLSILLSFIISSIFLKRSLVPLTKLVAYLSTVQPYQMLRKIQLSGSPSDEISELTHAFNTMLDNVGSSIIKQQEFIANASHELRTPLTKAVSSLDLAGIEKDGKKRIDYIKTVKEDLFSLNDILETLLFLSRLNDPLATPAKDTPVVLRKSIGEVVGYYKENIITKHLKIRIDADSSITLIFPKEHLRLLLTNLISNAIKYTFPKGTIIIRVVETENQIRLSVQDSGIGIPKNEQEHIFERFFRGSKSHRSHGAGLGLSLVKSICDRHTLKITVTSSAVKPTGTTVTVVFPKHIAKEDKL